MTAVSMGAVAVGRGAERMALRAGRAGLVTMALLVAGCQDDGPVRPLRPPSGQPVAAPASAAGPVANPAVETASPPPAAGVAPGSRPAATDEPARMTRYLARSPTQILAEPRADAPVLWRAGAGDPLLSLGQGRTAPGEWIRVVRGAEEGYVRRAEVQWAYEKEVQALGVPGYAGGNRFRVAGVEVRLDGLVPAVGRSPAAIADFLDARDRSVACRAIRQVTRCEFTDGADLGFELLRAGLMQASGGGEYADLAPHARTAALRHAGGR
ncbi:MAG TPA: hypothetical protein VEY95_17330 [Azospirillaceae bacterium]|nr:hypothetical protein [Azospirillaceae bacterium]